jgi:predicted signal transduction protein with EAL and GGDEF domain
MGQRDHIVERAIGEMRAQGLRIALDDFGTGYAPLTHLMTVPVNIIKIDKSFVDQLAQRAASRAIVEGLLQIAGRWISASSPRGSRRRARRASFPLSPALWGRAISSRPRPIVPPRRDYC